MGLTPNHQFPYPDATDPADVPTDLYELATAVDNALVAPEPAPPPPLTTAPPASPVDGELWMLPADPANGVVWMLRYNPTSPSPYKWEFVGGGWLAASIATMESTNSTVYTDLATVGPSVTLPRPGDYVARMQASIQNQASYGLVDLSGANVTPSDDGPRGAGLGYILPNTTFRQEDGLTASTYKLVYRVFAGSGDFAARYLAMQPVRLS